MYNSFAQPLHLNSLGINICAPVNSGPDFLVGQVFLKTLLGKPN